MDRIQDSQTDFQEDLSLSDAYASLYNDSDDLIAEAHAYRAGSFRFNWNSFLDVTLVLKGAIRIHTEEGTFDAAEDMFAIINPNIGHAALAQQEDTVVLVLTISEKYVKQVCHFLPVFKNPCVMENPDSPLSHFVRALMASFFLSMTQNSPDRDNTLFACSQIDLLLSLFVKYFLSEKQPENLPEKSISQRRKTKELIRYIDQHFREDLSLSTVAAYTDMNPSYLSSYFRTNIGLGFHEYVTRKRLAYAVYLLNHTDGTILDVALNSGFSDIKPFYSAFQKYLKLSPGKYRAALRAKGGTEQVHSSHVLPSSHRIVQEKLWQFASRPILLSSVCDR